jgi:HD-like signal output (HDOD) protein/GGDEF domain-containing protein
MASAAPGSALSQFVARAGELYSLPAVAMKVLELTDSPKVDVRALKQCIENDPALTTRILRVVNSSLFGLPREVSDLNQALALLGIKPLKLLVLGFSLPDNMFAGVEAEVLGRYWRRALTRGVAARELCDALWRRDGDEAFIAGLLRDVGVLVLIRDLGEPYIRFLDRVYAEQRELSSLERDSLGFTHVELSARLLDCWHLPDSIVHAVGESQNSEPNPKLSEREQRLASVVRLADLLTAVVVDRRREALTQLMQFVQKQFGWSNNQVAALVSGLDAKVAQLADVLSLSLPGDASYAEVLNAAQRQLASAAESAIPDVVRADRARKAAARDGDEDFDELYRQTMSLTAAMQEFLTAGANGHVSAKGNAATAPRPEPDAPRNRADAARGISRPTFAAAAAQPTAVVVDTNLAGRLSAAVAACRTARQPLSLVIVAIDRLGELAFALGPDNLPKAAELTAAICKKTDHPDLECLSVGDGAWAVLLPDCDRNQAVTLASDIVTTVHRLGQSRGDAWAKLSTSAGVATVSLPPRNFAPSNLVEKASRCLYGAQASGGDVVKSIEIY